MTNETMTIHEALSELKMLDSRINRKIESTSFCEANKHSNSKINGFSIDDYKKNVVEVYQSINDLIRRRGAIRNALSNSNAITTITVGGKTYTIAEAIEMKKTGVDLLENLKLTMTEQYNSATRRVRMNNDALNEAADRYVQGLYGSKEKSNSEEINKAREVYVVANTIDFIDPLGIQGEIEKLAEEIETFSHEVDSKISVSNALTTISISY